MKEETKKSLVSAYLLAFTAATIFSVVHIWNTMIVEHDFEIFLPEGGIENMEIEE